MACGLRLDLGMARSEEITVAGLATAHPAAVRVLYRHGIEFCVGGSRPLRDACREAAVEVEALLAEVGREEVGDAGVDWAERPLGELVDHILIDFHAVERRELDRLLGLFDAGAPPRDAVRAALAETCRRLRAELAEHMAKEETVLFPWIHSGRGVLARAPIQVMMMEHDATLRLLNEMRGLRQAYAAAPGASAALVAGLADLDRHVREHMHLENNILFTRALRGDE